MVQGAVNDSNNYQQRRIHNVLIQPQGIIRLNVTPSGALRHTQQP